MERNWRKVREVLEEIAAKDDTTTPHSIPESLDKDKSYAADLLIRADYLRGQLTNTGSIVYSLTWSGHNLLDHLREKEASQ